MTDDADDLLERIKDVIDDEGANALLKKAGLYFDGLNEDDIWERLDGRYFDRDGKMINMRTWSVLHADFNYQIVLRTYLHHARVSTVWLGMDHSFLEDGPPLIFETMIFPSRMRDYRAPWSHDTYRWHTLEQARRGHEGIVNKIRNRGMNAIRTRAEERERWPTIKKSPRSSSARRTATTWKSPRTRRA